MNSTRIRVALPTSILSTESSLLQKTIRVYQTIRYSSIFGVYELIYYRDPFTTFREHSSYCSFIEKIWRYLVTPPYLRKKLVPLNKELRYVGVLPPLRLETYDVSRKASVGEKRVGYVFRENGKLLVDIGLQKPFHVEGGKCLENELVYVEIVDPHTRRAVCLDEKPYMGPVLVFMDNFKELVKYYGSIDTILIATSKYGRVPRIGEVESLRDQDILLLFGSPRKGLFDIASRAGLELEKITHYVWNTMPGQKVKTIRSEEALLSTLAIINIVVHGENL